MDNLNPTDNKRDRVSPIELTNLLNELTDSQRQILTFLDNFHYAYGSQLQRLYFIDGPTLLAMTRARNRLLTKMVSNHLIFRYDRHPLPGNRHGSTEHIYTLAHAGQRIMNDLRANERPYRSIERTTSHFDHALAVTELYIQLVEQERVNHLNLLIAKGEPACHRHIKSKNMILKPDAFFEFHIQKDGHRYKVPWFIEVEHTRHGIPNLEDKVRAYLSFMDTLNFDKEVMPRVLFIG